MGFYVAFNSLGQRLDSFVDVCCYRYSYDDIVKITGFLKEKTLHRPTIGIICGSGLGGLANLLENQDTFPYRDIPNFPVSTGKQTLQFCSKIKICSCVAISV